MTAPAPLLQVRDVVKDFGGVRAVDHCSFGVMPGTITGLIGPNGAGKTTLFNLISGALPLTSGQILCDGRVISGMRLHQDVFARDHAHVPNPPRVPAADGARKPWPWCRRIRAASGSGPPGSRRGPSPHEERRIEAKALEVLEFVKLAHLADEYAGNLSTGQKKLLELARTLMAEPRLVLLDEPGAGVNRTLLGALTDNIQRASAERGVTFLLIEHDMDLVMRLCDPVIVMANGAVIAQGSPRQIQRDPQVLEAYLGGVVGGAA